MHSNSGTSQAVAAHTPLPFAIESESHVDSHGQPLLRILGALDNGTGGHLVATMNNGWGSAKADAALIVRAVNNHDALVAALERALAVDLPNVKWTRAEIARSRQAWRDQAKAALQRATA